jgi:hypothetical protein
MGNILYLYSGKNVTQNKLDWSEKRQGKMMGFCKHDFEPSTALKAGNLDVSR